MNTQEQTQQEQTQQEIIIQDNSQLDKLTNQDTKPTNQDTKPTNQDTKPTNQDTKTVNIIPTEDEYIGNPIESKELSTEEAVKAEEVKQYKDKVEKYITLITSTDQGLIDYEYIYNRGHHYIKLYKEDYLTYLEKLKQITAKYYNSKKYGFNNTNKQFEVISLKDNSSVIKVDKPKCRNVSEYLYKAKIQIQRDRFKLTEKYNNYLVDKNLTSGMISGFNKKRGYFINKLNEYYAIQYYYNRINLINNNFKMDTSRLLKQDKIEYSIKYIPEEKINSIIDKSISLRDKYISSDILTNPEFLKEYIRKKHKFDKKENNTKKTINTIILNKDIILHKFKFNNNNNNNINHNTNNNS
jgi:hypothetical protein